MEVEDLELVRSWNFSDEVRKFQFPILPVSSLLVRVWYDGLSKDSKKIKLMICEKESGIPVGLVGASGVDHVNKNCELGLTIGPSETWRKGLATDAGIVFCDFLFRQLGMHLIYGRYLKENIGATTFQKKIGFVETGLLKEFVWKDGCFQDVYFVSMLYPSFREAKVRLGYE